MYTYSAYLLLLVDKNLYVKCTMYNVHAVTYMYKINTGINELYISFKIDMLNSR